MIVLTPFLWTFGEGAGMPTIVRTLDGFARNDIDVHVVLPDSGGAADRPWRDVTLHTFGLPTFGLQGEFGPESSSLLLDAPARFASPRWKAFLTTMLALSVRRGAEVGSTARPDVVYGVLPTGAIAAALLARRFRVPNVSRLLGTYIARIPRRQLISHLWEVAALKTPTRLLIATEDGTEQDRSARRMRVPPDRLHLLVNGVDETFLDPGTEDRPRDVVRHELGFPRDVPLLMSAQYLIELHHVDALIDALAEVAGRGIAVNAVICGGGPERSALERRVDERGVRDRVRFMGNCERPRIRELMAASDAVVSLDGLGNIVNSVLEGFALGKPAIASDVGSTGRVLLDGSNALLITPTSVPELADRIARFSTDEELRERLSVGARDTGTGTIRTWDARVDHEAALIRDLVATGANGPTTAA